MLSYNYGRLAQRLSSYFYIRRLVNTMSRNGELDSLKAKEQEAFRQKQAAYQRYEEAKKLTDSAYINMRRCRHQTRIIVRFGLSIQGFVMITMHEFNDFALILIMSIE